MTTDDNIEDEANEREVQRIRRAQHRRLLNDIEQARVQSAEQSVVEGLRAKGLLPSTEQPRPEQATGESSVPSRLSLTNDYEGVVTGHEHDDAPAAPERGEWWRISTSFTSEPERAVYAGDRYLFQTPDADWSTLNQIITEHNQHSTLIAQRERLLAAIRKFVDYYDGANATRLGNGQARRSLDEFRAVLTAITSEGRGDDHDLRSIRYRLDR